MPSLSGSRITARERRTLQWGAAASVLIIAIAVLLPIARQWRDRELLIAARRDELARLQGLATAAPSLQLALDARTQRVTQFSQRPLSATTAALASGALQGVLQRYADESQLSVSELNVSGEPDSTAVPLPAVPGTLIALGDVYGVADLVARLQHGSTLLDIRELTVQVNPARRAEGGGELLQVTLVVRAPFVLQ